MSARDLGSARAGLNGWLAQRISALYLGGFSLFATLRLLLDPIADYPGWRGWLGGGAMRVALAIFLLAVIVHGWLGLRSVWMDYLHSDGCRFLASVVTGLVLLTLALWSVQIVLWDLRP
ncbi:MAG: succinate dehydrogenase, hydrophobic membrane anchor protein [Candidatus Muproteobacteria bacterium RBG_16_64_11]|uniref:Succinate dehydrogenase hydrophobic membrane anchor subunit n=1 Tax=Candidatus Muproteobacteria bacterium RBG_16_64_11 TaxID=1817758 RepID=A0A1F6T9E6_9PROT|nr:MAG: succinate dehydrogenase, hydrophobic membrane anchor protein [Candidatus Muproteobacteria bacterium RBG_16_64_11]